MFPPVDDRYHGGANSRGTVGSFSPGAHRRHCSSPNHHKVLTTNSATSSPTRQLIHRLNNQIAQHQRSLSSTSVTDHWDNRFKSTVNKARQSSDSSSGSINSGPGGSPIRGEPRRRSIMDYGSDDGGGGGNRSTARRESLSGDAADTDFLARQQEDAYLIPLKEDLADWLNKLLDIQIDVDNFMDVLDSGVHVCKLAKLISANAEEAVRDGRVNEKLPKTRLRFKENARSGTWFARDNVANFIKWCRDYGVKEECLFETEGLVTHRTPKNFILCLLELGRMAYKYNMDAPCLVAMEKEIDRQMELGSTFGDGGDGGGGGYASSLCWSPDASEVEADDVYDEVPPQQQPQSEVFENRSPRESRIPVRTPSSCSTMSTETLGSRRSVSRDPSPSSSGARRSVSPSPVTQRRRSCSSRSTSPRADSRSSSPSFSSSSSPRRRSRIPSSTDIGVVTNTTETLRRSFSPVSVSTSSMSQHTDFADGNSGVSGGGGLNTNCRDAATSADLPAARTRNGHSISVGTSPYLRVSQSTGTNTINGELTNGHNGLGSSSVGTSTTNGTSMTEEERQDLLLRVRRRRRSDRSPSPGRCVMNSNGTMTSAVDTRVNAGSNTDPQGRATATTATTTTTSTSTSTTTSPDTPRRSSSVWRRSGSPQTTKIPVPVGGTSAHGHSSALTHGVSSGSINSISSSGAGGGGANGTPKTQRRRSSISAATENFGFSPRTNGSTSSRVQRRASMACTPTGSYTTNGDTPRSVRRRSSMANGDHANNTTPTMRRRSSLVANRTGSDTPSSARSRRSSLVSANGDNSSSPSGAMSGGGTKTPRRRSMSTRSDKSDELDKEVRRISSRCECPQCYQIDRLSEGKYRIGDRVVFVRLLKGKHVMVRVGGGWDTLDHYLTTHDPCRVMEVRREPSCHSLTDDDDKFLFIHGKYKGQSAVNV